MGCGVNKVTAVYLLIALFSTYVAIPLVTFTPQIYGRPSFSLEDLNFIKDYVFSWWQKIFRRLSGHVGPAENVTVDPSSGQRLGKVRYNNNPQTAAEVVKYVQVNSAQFSSEILNYLQVNRIPNKSVQIDVLIVPDNLYVTFAWDGSTLTVYDGWQADLGYNEWVEVVVAADTVVELWNHKNDVSALKNIILNAEKNGELVYKLHRVNPITSETVLWLDVAASIVSIVGWTIVLTPKLKKLRS